MELGSLFYYFTDKQETHAQREKMNERTEAGADRKTPVTEISHKISPHSSNNNNNIMTFPRLGLTAKNPPSTFLITVIFDFNLIPESTEASSDRKEVASPGQRKPFLILIEIKFFDEIKVLKSLKIQLMTDRYWQLVLILKNKRKHNVQEAV
jgi:hypothetical protein